MIIYINRLNIINYVSQFKGVNNKKVKSLLYNKLDDFILNENVIIETLNEVNNRLRITF